MTVSELIEELRDLDGSKEVHIYDSFGDVEQCNTVEVGIDGTVLLY